MLSSLLIFVGIACVNAKSGDTKDGEVRLMHFFGDHLKEGRLEIRLNDAGKWGTVCGNGFTNASARVACHSLGYGYIGTVIGNRHGAGTGPIWLDNVNCTGTETSIKQCAHNGWGVRNCSHGDDVSISCGDTSEFAVRLINSLGYNPREGRLEIYYSGRWGTVCDDGFTNVSATVACASLGFGYIGAAIGSRHGPGTGPIWADEVNCNGTESGIGQCAHRPWGNHSCNHTEDVSISCACGERYFSGPSGEISSPNFPKEYSTNLDCYNFIRVNPGHTVTITFLKFDIEPCCDWVTITCESGNAFTSPSYAGPVTPAVPTISSCNLVKVYFHTDITVTYPGFSLMYNITSGNNTQGGENNTPQNLLVLILLGVAGLAIVILLAVLFSRICRQQKKNTASGVGNRPISHDNEYDLRRRGGRNYCSESDDVADSGYDKLGGIKRRLPTLPRIYDELLKQGKGDELRKRGEGNLYEAGLGNYIDVIESDYDFPVDIQRGRHSTSAIYDEILIEDED